MSHNEPPDQLGSVSCTHGSIIFQRFGKLDVGICISILERGSANCRQGDPGSTRYFLSLEDNLFRIFGGDRIRGMMNMLQVGTSLCMGRSAFYLTDLPRACVLHVHMSSRLASSTAQPMDRDPWQSLAADWRAPHRVGYAYQVSR